MPYEKKENSFDDYESESQKKDIVVILGGVMQYRGEEIVPRFPLVSDTEKKDMGFKNVDVSGRSDLLDNFEVSGGDSRMLVAQKELESLRNQSRPVHFLTTGGMEYIRSNPDAPRSISRATAAKDKLLSNFGFDESAVSDLSSGKSTLGNAQSILNWVRENHAEVGDLKEIKIITNSYHMLRSWLMFVGTFYKEYVGDDLTFSPDEIENIRSILKETESDVTEGDNLALKGVMEIVNTKISDKGVPIITPIIVEDRLKLMGDAEKRYADAIKNNIYVRETRFRERQGILDLIEGNYVAKQN